MHSLASVILLVSAGTRAVHGATVFAHFMVQNSYSYSQTEWETDIKSAKQIGIDGFGWQADRIDDAFTVAAAQDFKIMHSFDMNYASGQDDCPTGVAWNTSYMVDKLSKHATSDAAFKWNGDVLVSTFGGELYGNDFFASLKSAASSAGLGISLAPALDDYSMAAQSDPQTEASKVISDYPSVDGFLNWQAWPLNEHANLTTAADTAFKSAFSNAGRTGPYIMAVSPWQFKDLNEWGNWLQYSDTLFDYRWKDAINTVKPDIIEILTWNDFPESHYIRDLPPASETGPASMQMGDAGSYVYGIDHSGWRVIAQYYISWWKTGSAPAVTEDRVVYWYRIHPKGVTCSGGTAPSNADFPTDAVFVWALMTSEANISTTVGSSFNYVFTADESGPKMNMIPFPTDLGNGVYPMFGVVRDGVTDLAGNGSVAITSSCAYQNYNPVVGLVGAALS
ncbi:glycoside hydrolase family 71 protein [Lophium mytilinum]|uniref:Glycoside hydrolase family 71 protein n=1 Tax=Lophium mytilinum TaxID=390894 RepID=A0A6A6QMH2_9PEZI|nr:glycoside hydrolase family 71 protein [Lophium mytilinum]